MLKESKNAVEVDGNRAMPLLVGHAVDGCVLGGPDSVIGNQDVEPSERVHRRRNQFLCRRGGGKVRLYSTAIGRAAFADEVLGLRLGRLIIEDHFGSGTSEQPDRGCADAAGASRNESDLGIKSQVHNGYKYRTPNGSRHLVGHLGFQQGGTRFTRSDPTVSRTAQTCLFVS